MQYVNEWINSHIILNTFALYLLHTGAVIRILEDSENFHIFWIHYILMFIAQESKTIQYLKILDYLHLSFIKWPSLQYKFWVFLDLWNHNNKEDS